MASNIKEALKKEKDVPADEAWIDSSWDWPTNNKMGFKKQTP